VRSKSVPPRWEEEERHSVFIIKDEFVGAIHELPLRDTTHMLHFLP